MNRPVAVLSALLITACSSNQPAAAQLPAPTGAEPPPTLQVSATATVKEAPDVAVIQLAVETMAPTAAEASDENAARMAAVLEALLNQGVDRSAVRTQRLELRPQYDRRRDADPEIVAYQAVNQVTVRLEEMEGVGAVVDAAVRSGANRVGGIHFELADPEAAYHQALRQAIEQARAEAAVAAEALGGRLGDPLQVSTGGFSGPPVPMGRGAEVMMAADAAAPPVEPGEVEIRASVSITWRLET